MQRLSGSKSRLAQRGAVAALLNAVEPEEVAPMVRMLTGRFAVSPTGQPAHLPPVVLWQALEPIFALARDEVRARLERAATPGEGVRALFTHAAAVPGIWTPEGEPLTIAELTATLTQMVALNGSALHSEREVILREVLCRANADEAQCIVDSLFTPHLAGEDLVLEGIALAADIDLEIVRRGFMVVGDIARVAALALIEGVAALERYELNVFTPLRPMLAQTVDDLPAAWMRLGGHLALEYRPKGARVQVHLDGDSVRLYSRHLMEITASMSTEIQALRESIVPYRAVLEGELVALDPRERILPFQELMRRLRHTGGDLPRLLAQMPLRLFLFDLLLLDGEPLIDHPYTDRRRRLEEAVHPNRLVQVTPRLQPDTVEGGVAFFHRAVDAGCDGLIAKRLDGRYLPGMRGVEWLKVREALTMHLAITAVEWGCGEHACWVSNYHLAARDIVSDELVLVGKTAKELNRQDFAEMTHEVMAGRDGVESHVVPVPAPLVVEVGFTRIERNPDYPADISLDFARILRFRPERTAQEITTLQTLRDLYALHTGHPWSQAA